MLTKPCKTCQSVIWWAVTVHGKAMPMDAGAKVGGEWVICGKTDRGAPMIRRLEPLLDAGKERYRPHWATCPDADDHRKRSRC